MALEISPIYGFQTLGGQYFFNGQKNTLTGDVSGYLAPAMKLNDRWSLLPTANGAYQGTKQVIDVVGAGTLFQQEMDYRSSVTGIYGNPDSKWRFKPTASFKYQLLQETHDESWGNGLFDYYKWDVGMGADYVYADPFAIRMGLDYYQMHFPNYTSLESQTSLDVNGAPLARELVGNYVLDTQNIAASLGIDAPLYRKLVVGGNAIVTYEQFPNQHVVDNEGQLTSSLRHDLVGIVNGNLKYPLELNHGISAVGSLDTAFTYDTSNQNSFDATQTQFITNFYDYWEISVGPSVKLFQGPKEQPMSLELGVNWWYRRYPSRLAQDSTGIYQSQYTHTTTWMISGTFAYPVVEHFDLLANIQYGQAASNMQFQEFYAYNYTVANYLFGFRYDF